MGSGEEENSVDDNRADDDRDIHGDTSADQAG